MNFCQKTIKIAQRLFGTEEYLTGTHQVLIMTKLYREGDVASLYYHILIHNSRKQLVNVATRSNQLVLPYAIA